MSYGKTIVFLLLFGFFFNPAFSQGKVEIKVKTDSVSYSIGYNVGTNLLNQFTMDTIPFNANALIQGLRDGLEKQKTALTTDDMTKLMMALQQELNAKREEQRKVMEQQRKVAGEENKKKGEAFLAENAKKEGVKTTASGLQYKVIKMGTGKKPTANNEVKVNYKGSLIDGKVFDESKEPISFPVTGVIKGWTEALQLMPEGSKWILYIPSDLAYGERGAGRDIGPNESLVFEVELLQVSEKSTETNPPINEKPAKK